ncbi:MAG TPA: metalloregulator ArsR/SmtB family transcription factor [Cyclobacteriaceae bacterium]|nr:metalloregulator ArsR/SmtB family transcription factor [Cyclobacteriaceae bacterium]
MGITKAEVFNDQQNKMARYAKAFAHPARVAIIEYLVKAEACICGDLVGELPLAQSTISQHLKELKNIGIITGEIEGPRINYCINEKAWAEARSMLGKLMDSYKKCC